MAPANLESALVAVDNLDKTLGNGRLPFREMVDMNKLYDTYAAPLRHYVAQMRAAAVGRVIE